MPSYGLEASPDINPWLMRSSLGVNYGLGSAFRNPLSPRKNKNLEYVPSSIANEIERDGIVPRFYGAGLKVYPKHAAQPYTLNYGTDIRLHCVFILGYGPLSITNLKIGSKPISEFGTDIEYEIRTGNPGDSALTLFTQDVNEEQPNRVLEFGAAMTSDAGLCNHVMIDVKFPRGLYQIVNQTLPSGSVVQVPTAKQVGVYVQIQRRDNGTIVFDGTKQIRENIQGPFVRTLEFPGLAKAEYNVHVQRAQAPGDQSTNVDEMQCISIKGVKYGSPIRAYKDQSGSNIGIAYVAMRVKGSAKTQGALDAFNCQVTSILNTWNGSAWTPVESSAPADVVADLLCGTVNPRPIPRARLNGAAFQAWKTATQAAGFYCNGSFEESGELLEDAIQDVCFAGRGLYLPRDESGLHSVRYETTQEAIADFITPLNSANFRMQKVLGDIPHAIKAQWISAADDYVQETTIVPRAGYTEETATTFEAMTFRFVNNHSQVVKLARYHWACALLRPTSYEFDMNAEYRLLSVGSRIKFTNDLINYGLGEGRVKSLVLDGSNNCTSIIVSEPFEMVSGREYAIRVRFNDGTSTYQKINAVEGLQTELFLNTPIPDGQPMPEAGDLVLYSYLNQEADLIVTAIIPGEDLTATIQCLDYSPDVYSADTASPLPSYTPPISVPERAKNYIPPVPTIKGILSDENIMLQYGTTLIPRIKVSYEVPNSNRVQNLKVQWKHEDETEFGNALIVHGQSGEFYILDVREGANYDIRLQSVADNNYTSDWVQASHNVVGRQTPPPDILSMFPQGNVMQLVLPPLPIDFAHVQIRVNFARNDNWEQAVIVIDKLVSSSFPLDLLPDGLITVLAKTFDTAGNASTNARVLIHDFGATVTQNVFLQDDSQPLWTDCTITNGTVVGGEVHADDLGSKFYSGSPTAKVYSHTPGAKIYTSSYKALTVERVYEPRSDITEPWILKLDYEVDAENYHVFFKAPGSGKVYKGNAALPMYSGDADAKVYDKNGNDYLPWNGERIGKKRKVYIKIECPASTIKQAKVKRLGVIADMPDIEDDFVNQIVGPSGLNIALSKTFRQITSCVPVLQADAAYPNAASAQLASALPYTPTTGTDGPLVKVFDTALAATSGKVAGKVKGW